MSDPSRRPESLWWSDPEPPFPPFEGSLEADVLIAGGGITGLTLAWTLVEQGASVALFEAGPLAGGASGRNAGFLMALPAEPYREQIEFWGRTGARAMLEIGRRNHQRIRRLVESLGIDCDYRVRGSVRLARTEEEAEDHRDSLALAAADGLRMREIRVADAVPAHAAPSFAAAFLTDEDGELQPVRFLHGVAHAARAKGASLFAHSRVSDARWNGGSWEVRAGNGNARGRTLVLATNAFAPGLCPALAPVIAPRRGQMLATAPLDREVAPRPAYAQWGYQFWRQTADLRLVIGGWRDLDLDGETGFDDGPTERIQRGIEAGLRELVPEGAAIDLRWGGTMGFARDGRPLVGWLDPAHHLAICAGFTGHGMGMAAGCTLDLAELLAWRKAEGIATLDPARFPELRHAREGFVALGAGAAAAE